MSARQEARTPGNPPGLRDIPFKLPEITAAEKRRARALAALLAEHYSDAHCELNYANPHELLIATILSAQATDAGVNKATPVLFKAFPTPADYAASSPAKLEPYIKSIGLFRNKAKSIHAAMTEICERFDAQVPANMDDLLTLRGVARKTANVVLGNAFGINVGFVVDTHIQRLARRFDLVPQDASVEITERRLMVLMPRKNWCDLSHQIIWHGRRVCSARVRECQNHPICRKYGRCCEKR